MATGTLLYVEVHSDKHPSNNPSNPENNEYFKHYFSESDIEKVFPNEKFEAIYFSETQRTQTAETFEFINLWLDKWNELNFITDPEEIAEDKEAYFKNNRQANFTVIFRKR